ncbi:MAG: hypothetical protein KBG29_13845 [Pseudomonadales bacterium]|nr:hypothetical protein [Pseudomonadales bacterium]
MALPAPIRRWVDSPQYDRDAAAVMALNFILFVVNREPAGALIALAGGIAHLRLYLIRIGIFSINEE